MLAEKKTDGQYTNDAVVTLTASRAEAECSRLARVTAPTCNSRFTVTLTGFLITCRVGGTEGVTAAGLTASPRLNIEISKFAAIATKKKWQIIRNQR